MNAGKLEVYLSFNGNCREALEFYRELFHGEVTELNLWSDLPPTEGAEVGGLPEMPDDAVMHASLRIGDVNMMMSENPYLNTSFGDNISLNWSHEDPEEVMRVWDGFVAAGAEVTMEIEPSFFAKLFGELTDQYGFHWQIMVPGEY